MEGFALNIIKLNIVAAAIILIVKIMAVFLKNRFTARWKYLIWLTLSLSLLVPVKMPGSFSILHVQIKQDVDQNEKSAVSDSIEQQNFSKEKVISSGNTVKQANTQKPVHTHTIAVSSGILKIFCFVWLLVAVLKLTAELISYRISMKKLERMSIPAYNHTVLKMYSLVYRQKKVKNPPELMQNASLTTPLLAGIFHTRLYLPSVGYSAEELKLVFYHELAHFSRKDLWYKMVLRICAAVYWFNPVLLIMLKEADKDVENLCDSRVISICSREDHKLYRRLLLRTVAVQHSVPYVTASLNDSTMVFKERIIYMLNNRHMKKSALPGVLLTLLLVLTNGSVVFSAYVAEQIPLEEEDRTPETVSMVRTAPFYPKVSSEEESTRGDSSFDSDVMSSEAQEIQKTDVTEENSGDGYDSLNSSVSEDTGIIEENQGGDVVSGDYSDDGSKSQDGELYGYILGANETDDENMVLLNHTQNGGYQDTSGNSYTYNGDDSWTDDQGNQYTSYIDGDHHFGYKIHSYNLQSEDGRAVTIRDATNGDYQYYDNDTGTGYINNGDGTWTDQNGNTYTGYQAD